MRQLLGMSRMSDGHFRAFPKRRRGHHEVLEPSKLPDDHDPNDDAGDDTARIADNHEEDHEPRDGRAALKGDVAWALAGGPPTGGREELDGVGDDFFARELGLFRESGIGHRVTLGIVGMHKLAPGVGVLV